MSSRCRKAVFIIYGILGPLYILLSRKVYEEAYARYAENWSLPAPYLSSYQMNPLVLWGLYLPAFIGLVILVLLIDSQLNYREYSVLMLIAWIGFLADVIRLFPKVLATPQELSLFMYLLYFITGTLAVGFLWLIRFLREKRRQRRRRQMEIM